MKKQNLLLPFSVKDNAPKGCVLMEQKYDQEKRMDRV